MAGSFEGLFGGNAAASQFLLWGVGYAFAESILEPVLTAVRQESNQALPALALSPDQLADMVIRGIVGEDPASLTAQKGGIANDDFHRMVEAAGEPPGLDFVLEAWRRGYIGWGTGMPGEATVAAAIRTSRLRPEWADTIRKMAVVPVGVADAVDAVVEGQITRAEGEAIAYQNGIDAAGFTILVNTRGNPPSPGELLELYRRGLIGLEGTGPAATSVQQGIFEGATKDKWWRLLAALSTYVPPPRTVTALEREGAIDAATAEGLYKESGLSPELAAVYSAAASTSRTTKHKELAESQVVELYTAKLATAAQATALLVNLGYTDQEAGFILALADHSGAVKSYTNAVDRIRTLYIGRKLTRAAAINTLGQLSVPPDARDALLATWDAEVAANVRTLTEAQIVAGWEYQLLDQAQATALLRAVGYTEWDAWFVLSVRNKSALPDEPAGGPGTGPAIT